MFLPGLDLNSDRSFCHPAGNLSAGGSDAHRETGLCSVDEHLPLMTFRRSVARYRSHHKVQRFSCLDQCLSMAFAQLTYRQSLRDIEACLRAQASKLYHLWIRSTVARNTLANANATRDWRIYCDFAQSLIAMARRLYVNEPFGVELSETVCALDATTIDLCLGCFLGRRFGRPKQRSSCIPCSTCEAISLRLFGSAMASGTRSTCSTS